jgi:hypothetical protein
MLVKLSSKRKKTLLEQLYKRDGKHCHYCRIKEADFPKVWGATFYGGIRRGRVLEIDRIDNEQGYVMKNCVLACALCNMAKSDKFKHDEFLKVGKVTEEIWRNRFNNLKENPKK